MIKKTYIIAFVMVLLVVFSTSFFTYQKNEAIQNQEVIGVLSDMGNSASSQYDSIFFQIRNTLRSADGYMKFAKNSRLKLISKLKHLCTNSYYIDELHIITAEEIFSTTEDLNFDKEEFEAVKNLNSNKLCPGLIPCLNDSSVMFVVVEYPVKGYDDVYLLVGLNYEHINELAKPDNYGSFDSYMFFISNDGYILYHPDKNLVGMNLFLDKVDIMKFANLSEDDYHILFKNAISSKNTEKNTYFNYTSFEISKIGVVHSLDNFIGNIIIASDSDAISLAYWTKTFKILLPLLLCFCIACYILVRYIFLITYTDYFTEIKNNLAFQKHLNKISKAKSKSEKYIVFKIDHLIDEHNKDFVFDDTIFYSIAKKLKKIKYLYSDVYRISRLSYVFVLNESKNIDEVVDLMSELRFNIEYDIDKKFYIKGSVLPVEVKDVTILKNSEFIYEKLLKYMDKYSVLLSELKFIDFINYEDLLCDFDKRIRERDLVQNIISNNQIIPYYQPIVEVKSSRIIKHEVLMRTNLNNCVLTTPDIILIAEEENLVEEIDYSIIKQSLLMYKNVYDRTGLSTDLSINLSCKSVHKDMIDFIIKLTDEYNISPSSLTFELTETATIEQLNKTIHYLDMLRNHGFLLAIDDFGTGYAHVELLSKLKVDYVKIDGIFIRDVENDPKKLKTLKGLVYLAKIYETKIIAEFVENIEVVKILEELNIEYAQGYYFGKPEPDIVEVCLA